MNLKQRRDLERASKAISVVLRGTNGARNELPAFDLGHLEKARTAIMVRLMEDDDNRRLSSERS